MGFSVHARPESYKTTVHIKEQRWGCFDRKFNQILQRTPHCPNKIFMTNLKEYSIFMTQASVRNGPQWKSSVARTQDQKQLHLIGPSSRLSLLQEMPWNYVPPYYVFKGKRWNPDPLNNAALELVVFQNYMTNFFVINPT